MANAITEAHSLYQVVELINMSADEESAPYYGWYDNREPEVIAGQYALDAAIDAEETDDDTIQANLDMLVNLGARFDSDKAFVVASDLRKDYLDNN